MGSFTETYEIVKKKKLLGKGDSIIHSWDILGVVLSTYGPSTWKEEKIAGTHCSASLPSLTVSCEFSERSWFPRNTTRVSGCMSASPVGCRSARGKPQNTVCDGSPRLCYSGVWDGYCDSWVR